jgi:hypothetical protein
MKTTWNIIKSETNRLKDQMVSNLENSLDTFNDHFLSTAEKIMHSIRHSDTEDTNGNKNQCTTCLNYHISPFLI